MGWGQASKHRDSCPGTEEILKEGICAQLKGQGEQSKDDRKRTGDSDAWHGGGPLPLIHCYIRS